MDINQQGDPKMVEKLVRNCLHITITSQSQLQLNMEMHQ